MAQIDEIKTSVFEPIKYTGFEKKISFLACALFSLVLIFTAFFPALLNEYRIYFGLIFAISTFILVAVDMSAALRTGKIRARTFIVHRFKQPVIFWVVYVFKLLVSISLLGLVWYFLLH